MSTVSFASLPPDRTTVSSSVHVVGNMSTGVREDDSVLLPDFVVKSLPVYRRSKDPVPRRARKGVAKRLDKHYGAQSRRVFTMTRDEWIEVSYRPAAAAAAGKVRNFVFVLYFVFCIVRRNRLNLIT